MTLTDYSTRKDEIAEETYHGSSGVIFQIQLMSLIQQVLHVSNDLPFPRRASVVDLLLRYP